MRVLFALLLLNSILSCTSGGNKSKSVLEEVMKTESPFILKGRWYSPGNQYYSATWFEFLQDEYYTWPGDAPKPAETQGVYTIDKFRLKLELNVNAEVQYYRIDLVSNDQIQMTQFGGNGLGLIYQRQE